MSDKIWTALVYPLALGVLVILPPWLWTKMARGPLELYDLFCGAMLIPCAILLLMTGRNVLVDIARLSPSGTPTSRPDWSVAKAIRRFPKFFLAVAAFILVWPAIVLWSLGWLDLTMARLVVLAFGESISILIAGGSWMLADSTLREMSRQALRGFPSV
jgi:hypothetical protein